MTTERANEVYEANRKVVGPEVCDGLTADERNEVLERWKQLPGSTCFNDAFFTFMDPEKVPPYQYNRNQVMRKLLKIAD